MCNCASCCATDSAEVWPSREIDELCLAKYRRAIDTGKIPHDPLYAAHYRYCWATFGFTPDLSVKVYQQPKAREPVPTFPRYNIDSTAQYVKEYALLNAGALPFAI